MEDDVNYFPFHVQINYKLKHTMFWLVLFIDMHNKEFIKIKALLNKQHQQYRLKVEIVDFE